MKRIAVVVALTGWLVASPHAGSLPAGSSRADALSQLRAALGGDAAIAGVHTIRARGRIQRGAYKDHIEFAAALPDRFIRTMRYSRPPRAVERPIRGYDASDINLRLAYPEELYSGGSDESGEQVSGFNRDVSVPTSGRGGGGPRPGASSSGLEGGKARFAEFVLPLLAGTSAAYPVTSTSDANVIVFTASATRSWRLELDGTTHLPVRMTWTTPRFPAAPPQMPDPEWTAEFSDFALVGNLQWPRRILTRLNGNVHEDARIERYEINVALSDKTFRK